MSKHESESCRVVPGQIMAFCIDRQLPLKGTLSLQFIATREGPGVERRIAKVACGGRNQDFLN